MYDNFEEALPFMLLEVAQHIK